MPYTHRLLRSKCSLFATDRTKCQMNCRQSVLQHTKWQHLDQRIDLRIRNAVRVQSLTVSVAKAQSFTCPCVLNCSARIDCSPIVSCVCVHLIVSVPFVCISDCVFIQSRMPYLCTTIAVYLRTRSRGRDGTARLSTVSDSTDEKSIAGRQLTGLVTVHTKS